MAATSPANGIAEQHTPAASKLTRTTAPKIYTGVIVVSRTRLETISDQPAKSISKS
jgi:hypothetical protein